MTIPVVVMPNGIIPEQGFRTLFVEYAASAEMVAVIVDRGYSAETNTRDIIIVPCEKLFDAISALGPFEVYFSLRKKLGNNLSYVHGVQQCKEDVVQEYNRLVLTLSKDDTADFAVIANSLLDLVEVCKTAA